MWSSCREGAVSLVWPEWPTCHADDQQASRWEGGGPPVFVGRPPWTPKMIGAGPSRGYDGPYGQATRTCGYCGSVHPEDLLRELVAGATLGGSDWKYGWPHKF